MEGRLTSPLEIPRLRGFRVGDGHGLCSIAAWRIIDGRPYMTLSNVCGGSREIDLESTAQMRGFLTMTDIAGALGTAAAMDQNIATFYLYCSKELWRNFKHSVKVQEPVRAQ
jgi:hypothetical protein